MRVFLTRLVIFIFLFAGLIIIFGAVTSKILRSHASFRIKTKPQYIVLGNSHSECAFNDALITSFSNLSTSAESYFYTYQKAKKILEQNESIRTVFIEFNNNQIGDGINEWIWGTARMSKVLPMYSPFMGVSEKLLLIENNPKGFLNAYSLSARTRMGYILLGKYDYSDRMGGYLNLIRDKTDSLLRASEGNMLDKNPGEVDLSGSAINIQYLVKTIELCRQYGRDVFLIRSPVHSRYEGYYDEKTFRQILNTDLKDVDFLDFSCYPLKDSEFGDFDHLNYRGALVFSEWFNRIISEGILQKTDKLELISSEIDSLIDKKQHNTYQLLN